MDRAAPAVTKAWPQRAGVARAGRAAMVGPGKGVGVAPPPPVNGPYLMKNVLANLGMLTNLRMLIDLGDVACYAGGQPVLDLSGQGTHFYRGFDGSPATDDPLFTGSVGGASDNETLKFEALNDTYIRLQGTNPAWVQNIHKTSWTGTMCWIFKPNDFEFYLFSDEQGSSPKGLRVDNVSLQTIRIAICGGTFGSIASITVNPAFTLGAWNFFAIGFNGPSPASSWVFSNGATLNTGWSTYGTPSAIDANNTLCIGRIANGDDYTVDTNFSCAVAWEQAWSVAQINSIYNAIKPRFPGMP